MDRGPVVEMQLAEWASFRELNSAMHLMAQEKNYIQITDFTFASLLYREVVMKISDLIHLASSIYLLFHLHPQY